MLLALTYPSVLCRIFEMASVKTPRWRVARARERPSLATRSRAKAAGTVWRDPCVAPRLSFSTDARPSLQIFAITASVS